MLTELAADQAVHRAPGQGDAIQRDKFLGNVAEEDLNEHNPTVALGLDPSESGRRGVKFARLTSSRCAEEF